MDQSVSGPLCLWTTKFVDHLKPGTIGLLNHDFIWINPYFSLLLILLGLLNGNIIAEIAIW